MKIELDTDKLSETDKRMLRALVGIEKTPPVKNPVAIGHCDCQEDDCHECNDIPWKGYNDKRC